MFKDSDIVLNIKKPFIKELMLIYVFLKVYTVSKYFGALQSPVKKRKNFIYYFFFVISK